ncbi:hypothetical protein F1880_007266 [Penicillium rolfsii]|nr:hypothetical protein F1880_007266 [Penicillium rolfsii]
MDFDTGLDGRCLRGSSSVEVVVVLWDRAEAEHLPDGVCCPGLIEGDYLVLEHPAETLIIVEVVYLVATMAAADSTSPSLSLMAPDSGHFVETLVIVGLAYLAATLGEVDLMYPAVILALADSGWLDEILAEVD